MRQTVIKGRRIRDWRRLLVMVGGAALLVWLAGCGVPSISGPAQGTIDGSVTASPTCPVERVSAPCSPAPVADRQVNIVTTSGSTAATTVTDANGHFRIRVAPGSYVVRVTIIPGKVGLRQITPGNVTVRANETTDLQIVLDTGIR
jgi:hypothetical protein